jgi:acyl carrier protein
MTASPALDTTVLEILADVLDEPADALTAHPVLAAHEWDSLASLEALAQIESRFGISLDLRSFHAARTVDDMVGLVEAALRA